MSLIDTFMPNDLCARCDEGEPVDDLYVTIDVVFDSMEKATAKLHFCSYACKEAFVRGAHAVKELPDVL
jgi:hypothetical protein